MLTPAGLGPAGQMMAQAGPTRFRALHQRWRWCGRTWGRKFMWQVDPIYQPRALTVQRRIRWSMACGFLVDTPALVRPILIPAMPLYILAFSQATLAQPAMPATTVITSSWPVEWVR